MSESPARSDVSSPIRLPTVLFALLLMAVGVVAILVIQRSVPQTISEATSPDGSWLVRVEAAPKFFGGYEVVVRVGNDRGEIQPGGFVIGLLDDLESAEGKYDVTFDDNETARIGDRVIEKSRYFN